MKFDIVLWFDILGLHSGITLKKKIQRDRERGNKTWFMNEFRKITKKLG